MHEKSSKSSEPPIFFKGDYDFNKMITLNGLSSIFWLLIGLYVCLHAYNLGFGKLHEPGPGFIFFLAGALLSILSVISLLIAFFAKAKENEILKRLWLGLKWQRVFVVLIGLCIYIFFFNLLGFILSAFLLLIFLFRIGEPVKWWIAILTALITVSISYAFFNLWLKIPFPKGFIGI